MLDAAFVESIKSLAERGLKPELIDVDENQKVIVVGGQVIKTFTKDEPFGSLAVSDFPSFVEAAIYLVAQSEQAVVKVSPNAIKLICDGNKPHKTASVSLMLKEAEAYKCLMEWVNQPKSISTINKLLRTKLANTFDEKLLPIFKQVEFSRAGATMVTKTTHRDTMGKTIDNAVKSLAGEMPEFLAFTTPMLVNAPCESVRMLFYVDVNHDNETIGISPVGDEIDVAIRHTVHSLIERLESDVPTALVVAGA